MAESAFYCNIFAEGFPSNILLDMVWSDLQFIDLSAMFRSVKSSYLSSPYESYSPFLILSKCYSRDKTLSTCSYLHKEESLIVRNDINLDQQLNFFLEIAHRRKIQYSC